MRRWLILTFLLLCSLLSPVFAGHIHGHVTSTGASVAYESSQSESSTNSTVTYTALNFGTAASNRVLVVIACARAVVGGDISSVTFVTGSISASEVSGTFVNPNGQGLCSIWYASVPTGTSGNITVVYPGTTIRTAISVYQVLTSTPTPSAGTVTSLTSGTTVNKSITVPSNGVGVVGLYYFGLGTMSFTNATLDNSATVASTNTFAVGHITGTGSVTVTGSTTGSANEIIMPLASWGP
jgi:hypothetical protein